MAQEVETKILNVDKDTISKLLSSLGAKQIQDTYLRVWWFNHKGSQSKKDLDWYLRIRTYSNGKNEVTWKGKLTTHGASRSHKEINFTVDDFENTISLFKELGLENYAYQEKYRISWKLNDWQFDLDTYPHMPSYLEIEGKSEEHIQEAIKLLNLENHKTSSEGERIVIEGEYGLNWFDMKFKK